VRKPIIQLITSCAIVLVFFSGFKTENKDAGHNLIATESSMAETTEAMSDEAIKIASGRLYNKLDLQSLGLSYKAMQYAYKGYEVLKQKGVLKKDAILTVVDFSQSSRKKRMYIIDVDAEKVLHHTYVAHGRNSGLDMATQFSNTPESLQSSLGFYVTKQTYLGKHGLSLRLEGKDKGFNCKAEARAVVLHGADYIGNHRIKSGYNGRSFGCPAVPKAESKKIINWIKDGTCLFIFHPSNSYLHGSSILNA
jgi:hypothetical protein